jgi:peptidoglycan/LPS O-acetylase OafA/YrhL
MQFLPSESISPGRAFVGSLPSLDLFRGLAALEVMFMHVRGGSFVEFGALPEAQHNVATATVFILTRLGQEAVLVFFVLSGFLVGGQILSRVRSDTFDITSYAIDRATRIFIPLIPAVLLTVAVDVIAFGYKPPLLHVVGNILGLNGVLVPTLPGNAPLWSLAYEIWFYVIGGTLGYMFSKKTGMLPIVILATATLIFAVLDARDLLYWGLGAVTVLAFRRQSLVVFASGAALAVFGTILHQLTIGSKSLPILFSLPVGVSEGLICAGICLILPSLCNETVVRIFHPIARPAAWIGSFSYSLYLVHFPVNTLCEVYLPKADSLSSISVLYFFVRLFVCVGVALVFYFCFERNTPKGRRLIWYLVLKCRMVKDA